MDALYLLDRLEDALLAGRAVPLSRYRVIDEDTCLAVVDQLREALTRSFAPATVRAVASGGRSAAAEHAERRRWAAAEGEWVGPGSAAVHATLRPPTSVEDEARLEAERLRGEADAYVVRQLTRLHGHVARLQQVIETGLADLEPESPRPASRPEPVEPRRDIVGTVRSWLGGTATPPPGIREEGFGRA